MSRQAFLPPLVSVFAANIRSPPLLGLGLSLTLDPPRAAARARHGGALLRLPGHLRGAVPRVARARGRVLPPPPPPPPPAPARRQALLLPRAGAVVAGATALRGVRGGGGGVLGGGDADPAR